MFIGYGASAFIFTHYEIGYSEARSWALIFFWVIIALIFGNGISDLL
jgi:hypothetical protein